MLITVATAGTLATVAACSSGATSQSVNARTRTVTATATHQAAPTPSTPTVTITATTPHTTPSSHGAAPSTATRVVIYGCDGQPVGQPAGFILFCGDAGEALQNLTWSSWGGSTATATGQLLEKTCMPNCAAGGTASYSATVTVSDLRGGRYTSMHVNAPSAPDPRSDFRLGLNGPVVSR